MSNFEVQVRSEETGIQNFPNLSKALRAAAKDPTIWKLSLSLPTGERLRMVRLEDNRWGYAPVLEELPE